MYTIPLSSQRIVVRTLPADKRVVAFTAVASSYVTPNSTFGFRGIDLTTIDDMMFTYESDATTL